MKAAIYCRVSTDNQEREADQQRLDSLIQTRDNITKTVDMESHLKELCTRIIPDLDNCTNQDKRDAYTYLDLEIKATPEGADIKGYVQPKLPTIAQTSGYHLVWTKSYPTIENCGNEVLV